ncbi:hypothetical protein MLD38_006527 [Melastoma candidum]|uniref:Uncharacterized protein n=1 Tax=Melastoma candidum TaxID=119954 RepID=A0ACB9RMU7_9MYRT|nr:hypothetical protein MLD38_006527 [Melastoma candidum]
MKLFTWAQNKLGTAKHCKKTVPNIIPPFPDEPEGRGSEDSGDWSRCLLTIGTLGSDSDPIRQQNPSVSTREEMLPEAEIEEDVGRIAEDSSLLPSGSKVLEEAVRDRAMLISVRRKDPRDYTNATNSTRKTTPALLLKQIFACGGGFPRPSCWRGPMPESKVDKVLKEMLRKKIHPRASPQVLPPQRYLEDGQRPRKFSSSNPPEREDPDKAASIKWDRTDSEYIVLEI